MTKAIAALYLALLAPLALGQVFTLPHDHSSAGKGGPLGAVSGTSLTTSGTVSAEQLTSTDDLTVTDLATLGRFSIDGTTWDNDVVTYAGGFQLTGTGSIDLLPSDANTVRLGYNGADILETDTLGINLHPSTGSFISLDFFDAGVAQLGHIDITTNELDIKNYNHGDDISLTGENTGGTPTTLIVCDPDDQCDFYYAGSIAASTTASGLDAGELTINSVPVYPVTKVKTASETVNNSATLQDDDHLASYSLAASTTYIVDSSLMVFADGTAQDLRFELALVSGTLTDNNLSMHCVSDTTQEGHFVFNVDTTRSTAGSTMAAGDYSHCRLVGYIDVNAAAVLTFQWAQASAVANDLSIAEGSWLKFEPVF